MIEQRIANLKQRNIARKASYPIAGSLIPFKSTSSNTYNATGGNNETLMLRIKFTAERTHRGNCFCLISAIVSAQSDFSILYPKATYVTEPQTGDGTATLRVTISLPATTGTYYIKAIASGSSGGTFSLISTQIL